MLELIANNTQEITIIIVFISGAFAFIKWIDSRNRQLKNYRYDKYIQLIKVLSGSKETPEQNICMTEQIASVWLLLEYKEYYNITLKILDNSDLKEMSNVPWQKYVLPQIEFVVKHIKAVSNKKWLK